MVVEVLGPAGAGKTSVIRALHRRRPDIIEAIPLPLTLRLNVMSRLLARFGPGRVLHARLFTREELRLMVYSQGWSRALTTLQSGSDQVIVFDHGPILMLGLLLGFCHRSDCAELERWSRPVIRAWASQLDVLVWLDAPNDVLLRRINARERKHLMKDKPEAEGRVFLDRCRAAFRRLLLDLTAYGTCRVLPFETSESEPETIAAALIAALDNDRMTDQPRRGKGTGTLAL